MKRMILAAALATVSMASNAAPAKFEYMIGQPCVNFAMGAMASFGDGVANDVYQACIDGALEGMKGEKGRHKEMLKMLDNDIQKANGFRRGAINMMRSGYIHGYKLGSNFEARQGY